MSNTIKKRITISLDPAIYRLLDKRNRSGDVERILKKHFQEEGFDNLYQLIKNKLIQEFDVKERIFNEEGVEMIQTPYGLQERTYE